LRAELPKIEYFDGLCKQFWKAEFPKKKILMAYLSNFGKQNYQKGKL